MTPVAADAWDPARYDRFAAERAQPFSDLCALLTPVPGGRVVDLGCGTGELTAELHRRTGAAATLGLDNSPAMLSRALEAGGRGNAPGLSFAVADIADFPGRADVGACDIVFSNAALQWLPDHPSLLARLTAALAPGGQLAVQVPANGDHPTHRLAAEVAAEAPFREALGGATVADGSAAHVLHPERYAELMWELGYAEQHVRLVVYGHVLESTLSAFDWVDGTTLVPFRRALPPALHEAFRDRYRDRLLAVLGDHRPWFYAFKRILLRGRRPSP